MRIRERILPTITVIAVFLYYIFTLLSSGLNYLQNDIIYGIISALCIFLLPALISKTVNKKYFGVGYILSTLIYPLIYAISIILHHYANIPALLTYRIAALLIFFSVLILTLVVTYTENRTNVSKISKSIIGVIITIALILSTRHFIGLEKDSLLSLDFLQHNAVSMQITDGEVCLTPNECSSLFKKLGYTTYYHTFQTVLTNGYGLELGIAETSMIIGFISISVLTVFTFYQKHFKDDELAFISALTTVFFFELGAYSFNFVIPQTFVLLLFLSLLTEKKLTWGKLLISVPIILATHFIFGPFFLVMLLIYKIFFSQKSKISKTITLLSFLAVIITFVANWRGFSIEKLIQQTDVAQLGSYTNYYFPQNLEFLAKQYGVVILPMLISTIHFLSKKQSPNTVLFAITYISLALSAYFVGPTYANKFLIGSSVFIVFLITQALISLKYKKFSKILIMTILLISTLPVYLINYSNYAKFYLQKDHNISALTQQDSSVVNYLKKSYTDCQILSDPYTQLIVTSQTKLDTAGGQYQELNTRQNLITFIQDPSENTYEWLLTSTDLNSNFCILLTSRLYSYDKYVSPNNIPWLTSLYEYEINNYNRVGDISSITEFLATKNFEITYQDSNFILFTPQ